jgi:hypothetical protein
LKLGLTWHQKLGTEECPYMERWVLNLGRFALRLHHWHRGDDPRHFHDHPWWFITFVLKGGYTDVAGTATDFELQDPLLASKNQLSSKKDILTAPAVRFRPAHHRHTVDVHKGGCWTFMITGRERRKFGFWVPRKDGSGTHRFKKANKYFLEHGHHPCD